MEWYPSYQCQRTKGHKLWDEKSDKNIWRKGERGRGREREREPLEQYTMHSPGHSHMVWLSDNIRQRQQGSRLLIFK